MINLFAPKKEEVTDEESLAAEDAVLPPFFDLPSTSNPPPTRAKRTRLSKNRSPFLRFFVDTIDPAKLSCVICNIEVRYMYGSKKVTSSLRDHLTAYHPEVMAELVDGDERHEQAQTHLLRAIALGELNLASLESPKVQAFVKALDPTFLFPVPELYGALLDDEYKMILNKVSVALLGQEVAITVDDWKYQWGITVSFIDQDWQRQFHVLPLGKTDKTLRNLHSRLQSDYNLKSITACITDVDEVQTAGERAGCILRACDDLVNSSLAAFDKGRELIERIRSLAAHLRLNEKSWEELKKKLNHARCIETKPLPIGFEGCWSITLSMLRIAKNQMAYLDESFHAASLVPPNDEEIIIIDHLINFLGEIEDFVIKMSLHTSTLSSLIPYIEGLERTIDELKDGPLCGYYPIVRDQFKKVMTPFNENNLVRRAFLLDPRFLQLEISSIQDTRSACLDELLTLADKEYTGEGVHEEPPPKKSRSKLLSKAVPQTAPEKASHAKREYAILLDLSIKSDLSEDADVCDFWRTHRSRLPRLSYLARRLLAIPPSSIPTERFTAVMGEVAGQLAVASNPKEPEQKRKLLFIGTESKKQRLRFENAEEYHAFLLQEQRDYELKSYPTKI